MGFVFPMLAIALALCALGAAPPAPDVAAVVTVLERGERGEVAGDRLAAELARLGSAFLPDLFAVLAFGSGLGRPLDTVEEGALTDALASFGAVPLRPFLRRHLSKDPPAEERLAALEVLGRVGSSEDLALLRLALKGAGSGLASALQKASGAILRRDARALEALRRWMLEAPLESGAALARAVRESACPRALEALASSLGYRADLDAHLLEELAPLAAGAPKPIEEELLAPIEDALRGDDARLLRPAALALGHAQHDGAVLALIPLLEHGNRGVSTAAEWALTNITGLRFQADAERWRAWLRCERDWFEANGLRVRAELRASTAEVAIRALGEVSSHRWRRHELALEVLSGLEHESALVRRLTCLTLARLGSGAARAGLVHALEDPDESVARAARQALEVLGLAPPGPLVSRVRTILGHPSRNSSTRSRNRPQDA